MKMKKKKRIFKIVSAIVCFVVVCLTGYFVYNKILNHNKINELSNDEALTILKISYNDIVRHIFNEGVAFCGEYDEGEKSKIKLNGFLYLKSATFNSFNELDSYVKKYLTENLLSTTRYNNSASFDETTIDSYYEKGGKLYCNTWNKGSNMLLASYSESDSKYEIQSINNNDSFVGIIDAVYFTEDNVQTNIKIKLTIINQNDNWLIDSYEEIE